MDRFDRIFELHKILSQYRRPVARKILEDRPECSRATVGRIIQDMRDFVGAPINKDKNALSRTGTEDGRTRPVIDLEGVIVTYFQSSFGETG